MGYIEETGAAQLMRDARISLIYEGTNGIQANDLLGRKLARDGGAAMRELIADMSETATLVEDEALRASLVAAIAALAEASDGLISAHRREPALALAGAVPYLRLVGIVAAGWLLAKGALAAARRQQSDPGNRRFYQAKLVNARFFAEHRLAVAPALLPAIAGGATVTNCDLDEI
jgi:hypothetical protein